MKLLVFSHFDTDDIIDEYVLYYLHKLKEFIDDIIFVSTSSLAESETIKIEKLCTKIICRENIGYDFMSYKIGLLESGLNYTEYDEVIICNDSVYGPLFNLPNVFNFMANDNCDCWGISENFERINHLQSFFIVFKNTIIASTFIENFFSKISVLSFKDDIINKYEVGMSVAIREAGFCYSSYVKYPGFVERFYLFAEVIKKKKYCLNDQYSLFHAFFRKIIRFTKNSLNYFNIIIISKKINFSLYFWEYNIKRGNPFLKIELLRKNPANLDNTEYIIQEIEKMHDYPVNLIRKHLLRTKNKY